MKESKKLVNRSSVAGGSNQEATYSFVVSRSKYLGLSLQLVQQLQMSQNGLLVDGLRENDRYGNFVPSLAEGAVSEDGLTYNTNFVRMPNGTYSERRRIWCNNRNFTRIL